MLLFIEIIILLLAGMIVFIASLETKSKVFLERRDIGILREKNQSNNKKLENLTIFFIPKFFKDFLIKKAQVYEYPEEVFLKEESIRIFFICSIVSLLYLVFFIMFNIPVALASFMIVYFLSMFLIYSLEKIKIEAYKLAMTTESIGILQQFSIKYESHKNAIKILEIIAESNKNKEIGRLLLSLTNEINTSVKKTPVEVIMEFKKKKEGMIGIETFLTYLATTIEQGVGASEEINSYCKSIIKEKALDKEKKVKSTTAVLELIMIFLFLTPLMVLMIAPTFEKNEGVSLGEMIINLIKLK